LEKLASLTSSGLESAKEFLKQTLLDILANLQSVPELESLTKVPFELELENYGGQCLGWQPKTLLKDCVAVKESESTEFYLDLSVTFEFSNLQSHLQTLGRTIATPINQQVNKLFRDKDLIMCVAKREMLKLPGIANINYYSSSTGRYDIEFTLIYFPKEGEI